MKKSGEINKQIQNLVINIDGLINFASKQSQNLTKELENRILSITIQLETFRSLEIISDMTFQMISNYLKESKNSSIYLPFIKDLLTDKIEGQKIQVFASDTYERHHINNDNFVFVPGELLYSYNYENPFLKRYRTIKRILEKGNMSVGIIQKLEAPFKWQDVTIILKDNGIFTILQHNKFVYEISPSELGIPKIIRNGNDSIYAFFMNLFLGKKDLKILKKYSTKSNANQQAKTRLARILQKAFNTKKDPFEKWYEEKINEKIYKPLFITRLGGDLREIYEVKHISLNDDLDYNFKRKDSD